FMGIHAIAYTEIRYSEPLHPILAIFIAATLGEVVTRFKHARAPSALSDTDSDTSTTKKVASPQLGVSIKNETNYVNFDRYFGWLMIGIIIVLGILFRCTNLDRKFYWHDEAYTSLRISGYTEAEVIEQIFTGQALDVADIQQFQYPTSDKKISDTIVSLALEDPHHSPLYYIMAKIWVKYAGASVTALRALSVLISLLVLPAIYWIAMELFQSRITAWIAVCLASLSPFNIIYAQEAREYSLWSVLIVLSGAVLLWSVRRPSTHKWILYGLTVALGLYTHQFFILVIIAFSAYVIILENFRWTRTVTGYVAATGGAIVSFIPWAVVIVTNFARLVGSTNWTTNSTEKFYLLQMWVLGLSTSFIDIDLGFYNIWTYILRLLVLGLVAVSFYTLVKNTHKRVWVFLLALTIMTFLPLAVPDLFVGGIRSTISRYLIPTIIGFVLAVSYLLGYLLSTRDSIRSVTSLVIMVVLFSGALTSWIFMRSEQTWWNKIVSPQNPTVAYILNEAAQPLLIVNEPYPTNLGDILSLSHMLDQDVKIMLFADSVIPDDIVQDDNHRDVFILNPSQLVVSQLELEQKYSLEPVVDNTLWRLTPQQFYSTR
ncbi:MAG: glycosyltransferase family 39 protein, partial [Anaerolineae bacterium]|nr:glycosyltransferase family 39 protein [Anaerolineae bacterium]